MAQYSEVKVALDSEGTERRIIIINCLVAFATSLQRTDWVNGESRGTPRPMTLGIEKLVFGTENGREMGEKVY